jgi:hypothetical protein
VELHGLQADGHLGRLARWLSGRFRKSFGGDHAAVASSAVAPTVRVG